MASGGDVFGFFFFIKAPQKFLRPSRAGNPTAIIVILRGGWGRESVLLLRRGCFPSKQEHRPAHSIEKRAFEGGGEV